MVGSGVPQPWGPVRTEAPKFTHDGVKKQFLPRAWQRHVVFQLCSSAFPLNAATAQTSAAFLTLQLCFSMLFNSTLFKRDSKRPPIPQVPGLLPPQLGIQLYTLLGDLTWACFQFQIHAGDPQGCFSSPDRFKSCSPVTSQHLLRGSQRGLSTLPAPPPMPPPD